MVQEIIFHDQHYMTMQPKITPIFLDELGVPRRFALGSLLKTAAAAHTPALPTYYWAQRSAVRQPEPAERAEQSAPRALAFYAQTTKALSRVVHTE